MRRRRIYRQGDVLLVESPLPVGAGREVGPGDGAGLVLARGEVSGHSHRVEGGDARLLTYAGGDRYLRLGLPAALRHEEHAPLSLPAGIFKVVIQREYVPGPAGPRLVED